MATSPRQDPMTVVRTSTALWGDLVRAARGDEVEMQPHDPAYQWSNGRTHYEVNPYGWTQDDPAP